MLGRMHTLERLYGAGEGTIAMGAMNARKIMVCLNKLRKCQMSIQIQWIKM